MSHTHSDLIYYKLRTVQISPRNPSGDLPKSQHLGSSLPNFGTTLYWKMLCIRDGEIVPGKPNTAIVVFALQRSVTKILESSRRGKHGSLWQTKSIKAHTLDKKGPIAEFFSTQVVPELGTQSESDEEPSDSDGAEIQSTHSDQEYSVPPAKRSRTESWGIYNGTTAASNRTFPYGSSHTMSSPPESPEWMRAQIDRLRAELNTERAISKQNAVRLAHETAMIHKITFDAALAQEEAEKRRLHIELEDALSRKSNLSNDVNTLRGQLAAAEEKLRQVRSYPDESGERVKALKQELEEAQDRAGKLLLQKSYLEQQKDAATTELNDAKEKLQKSMSEVELLKVDLASAQEQLKTTQTSLESMEQKYSSTHRMYETIKAKLGMYKSRHENEQTTIQKLKDTLTPEAYKSLGATYETLGAFLSITRLPPINEEGHAGPKKESD